ncbi:MAG: amidohydrolase family protein [Pseudomonadota bacterium]
MIIDAWGQIPTERMLASPWFEPLLRWQGQEDGASPISVATTLDAMDAAGVDLMLLSAWSGPQGWLISNDELDAQILAAPDRFRGVLSIDLNRPADAAAEIRKRFDTGRYVGVRVLPWVWDLPPNHALFYPVYAACVEVGAAFCTQIGHTGPLRRSEVGRPIPYLEDVLLHFPDLTVVGGHVGFPWVSEVISLTVKFPNFHIDTSAYALHRLPPDFAFFLATLGAKRVMFGSNWPMIAPEKCLKGLDGLNLNEETRAAYLSGNATRVFKL